MRLAHLVLFAIVFSPWVSVYGQEVDAQRELADLRKEITALSSVVNELDKTLRRFMDDVLAEMKRENRLLRDELQGRRTYPGALPSRKGEGLSNTVPRPDENVAPRLEELIDFMDRLAPGEKPVADKRFEYVVIKEWGRDAEDAKRLGEGVPSLKGMICVVPEWSTEAHLTELARRLRRQFAHYDNINVEVFNNLETAERYANRRRANPGHRVLNISKHKASGRDVAYLIRGDTVEEIPLGAGGRWAP